MRLGCMTKILQHSICFSVINIVMHRKMQKWNIIMNVIRMNFMSVLGMVLIIVGVIRKFHLEKKTLNMVAFLTFIHLQ